MKMLKNVLLLAGAALLMNVASTSALAQERPGGGPGGRGGFDPEQMRARMMERYREQFDVKNDEEWKVIETRVNKVLEARREMGGGFGGFGGPGGMGRRRGGDDQGAGGGNRQRFGAEPSPEAEALQKAIEAKAPAEEVKTKLAKFRDAQKVKEGKLTQAQDDLKKVLSVRQEAAAVMMGLLH